MSPEAQEDTDRYKQFEKWVALNRLPADTDKQIYAAMDEFLDLHHGEVFELQASR